MVRRRTRARRDRLDAAPPVADAAWYLVKASGPRSLDVTRTAASVLPDRDCHSERSRGIFASVARDYSFWVYIIASVHDRVLYTGVTNSLSRRISEHRHARTSGLHGKVSLSKVALLRAVRRRPRRDRSRDADQEVVALEKGSAD